MLCIGCKQQQADIHSHDPGPSGVEPLSYTLYSGNIELFVEFKPLVAGSRSDFATHLTVMGDHHLPLEKGRVSVTLIVGKKGIRNRADSASSPGIFRLALIPVIAGRGKLIFDIETDSLTEQFVLEDLSVYPNEQIALEQHPAPPPSTDIPFLKEQSWKVEFAHQPAQKTTFYEIFKAGGQLLSAPGDEAIITATVSGIVSFKNKRALVVGSKIVQHTPLFTISGGDLAENTPEARYKSVKADLEKAKADYLRASALAEDKIISAAVWLEAKKNLEQTQLAFDLLGKNYSGSGQTILAPLSGFLKQLLVGEGQFVEAGAPLGVIAQTKRLILQAEISQRYFSRLPSIRTANFRLAGDRTIFDLVALNGKLVSYGKSVTPDAPFLPVFFELDNVGSLIPGAMAEIFLISAPVPDALVLPLESLLEEQGNYYVYVQMGGESYQKREIKIGANDGRRVRVLSGLKAGERVVTKGAFQIRLAAASNAVPAHGHEH